MYVFNGLDVSTIHVKPETICWLDQQENHIFCPVYFNKTEDGGYLIWVYSAADDFGIVDDDNCIPEDLKTVILFAFERDCRLVFLDSDACVVEELPQYPEEWSAAENDS